MKKLLVLMLFLGACAGVSAQNPFFIYLESGNSLPFYVRVGDRVFSSATGGYLVLPELKDSTYILYIGFPSDQMKEAKFSLNMSGNDRGFIIKKGDRDIFLSDIQGPDIINALKNPSDNNVTYEAQNNAFTSLLAKAAGDSSLLFAPVFAKAEFHKKEEKKEKSTSTAEVKIPVEKDNPKLTPVAPPQVDAKTQKGDVAAVADTATSRHSLDSLATKETTVSLGGHEEKKEVLLDTAQSHTSPVLDHREATMSEAAYERSTVTKHAENSTTEGFGLTYYDKTGSATDTIQLVIPNPKLPFKENSAPQEDRVFLDTKLDTRKDSAPVIPSKDSLSANGGLSKNKTMEQSSVKEDTAAPAGPKASCANQATENDFFKLRKNMAAQQTDEAMVEEARKSFKNKCFTTGQIRYLSALFLTSAGKYQFFDAAFMHVSDQESFPSLRSEIKDDYYMRRFKALIGE
ncbi:MAG: hypothetical protein ACXVMS_17905 [Flavisolibacter sp.]